MVVGLYQYVAGSVIREGEKPNQIRCSRVGDLFIYGSVGKLVKSAISKVVHSVGSTPTRATKIPSWRNCLRRNRLRTCKMKVLCGFDSH